MFRAIALISILFFFFIIFLVIFFFIKLAAKKVGKQKESFWKGKLVDKDHVEFEDDDSSFTRDYYYLIFTTTEGKKVKISVPKAIYDGFKVGDKVEKRKGKLYPEKVS